MADFEIALARTLRFEGGYANNPNDTGGETYRGIARKFHSTWPGWQIIDTAKSNPAFPASLEANPFLQSLVVDFYRIEFWNKLSGEQIRCQPIANELFDCEVNMGHPTAVRILQLSLNDLSESGDALIAVDGVMGPSTLDTLNSRVGTESARVIALLTLMLVLRATRYAQIIASSPSQKQFAVGWFSRLFNEPEIQHRSSVSRTPASV